MKHDPGEVTISDVDFSEAGITISWVCDLGFGQMQIWREGAELDGEPEFRADTEHMACNDDKTFISLVLEALVKKINVMG